MIKSTDTKTKERRRLRTSGVLLHVSSLPGPCGFGDFGPAARRFVKFLADAGFSTWQVLPLNVLDAKERSPYSASCSFAGEPLYISPEDLVRDGLLKNEDVRQLDDGSQVDFVAARAARIALLRKAFGTFRRGSGAERSDFAKFCHANHDWLQPTASFLALTAKHPTGQFTVWPEHYGTWEKAKGYLNIDAEEVEFAIFQQYLFFRQLDSLKTYAAGMGVELLGDVPFYVSERARDVWQNPEYFDMTSAGLARSCAGAPPDYFSSEGQNWGMPTYDWGVHARTEYTWWISRLAHSLRVFDKVRLDHFIGFSRFWKIPKGEPAKNGRWISSPGRELFAAASNKLPDFKERIFVEDLGDVDAATVALRNEYELPGMRIGQIGFGEFDGAAYHHPLAYPENCYAYTGTHDNNTVVGWYEAMKSLAEREAPWKRTLCKVHAELGKTPEEVASGMVALVLNSPARSAIAQGQDLLALGADARMNTPGTLSNNWSWRMTLRQFSELEGRIGALRQLNISANRHGTGSKGAV